MKTKYNKSDFQKMILRFDKCCMVIGCGQQATVAHHIVYKKHWTSEVELRVGFGRDSFENGIGLCMHHHNQVHNGLGLNGMSGREFMYYIIESYEPYSIMRDRWSKVKVEIKHSLILKGKL